MPTGDPVYKSWGEFQTELDQFTVELAEELPGVNLVLARMAIDLCRLYLRPEDGLELLKQRTRDVLGVLIRP